MNPVAQITQVCSAASLVYGASPKHRQQIRQHLSAAAEAGELRRFRFDGRLHYAPNSTKGDVSFVVCFAEETSNRIKGSDCLPWTGAFKPRQGPVLTLDGKEHVLRRVIYERHAYTKLKKHEAVRMTCGDLACIAYDHMTKEPRNAVLVGKARTVMTRQRIAQKHWERMPYSGDQVSALKASCVRGELTRISAAKELGVSAEAMNRIVRGDSWRDFTNHFQAQLG